MTKEEKKEYYKAYREANKERIKEYSKQYREENREENREKNKEYYKAYREKNRDKVAGYSKTYREKNKEKLKQYREENRDKISEHQKEYRKKKLKTDPIFKLTKNLRTSSKRAWKGTTKPETTEKLLGCSYIEFRDYIESQFVGNMSWENYGDVWHIDHITPLAVIKDVSQKELIESLCHFSNLQPLFAEDNISKKDRLDYQYPAIYKTNLKHNSNK